MTKIYKEGFASMTTVELVLKLLKVMAKQVQQHDKVDIPDKCTIEE
jgi:hypothetical protein